MKTKLETYTLKEFLEQWDWEEMSHTVEDLKNIKKVFEKLDATGLLTNDTYPVESLKSALLLIDDLSKAAEEFRLWNSPVKK